MTRIDFYSLKEPSRGDRFLLACRLVERIYGTGQRTLIQVPDREQARHLDRLLWTFRQQSFLPHGLVNDSDRALTPILIGHGEDPGEENQVLINLSLEVPAFFERFERLCELIDQDSNVRETGRKRYVYYRDHGYPLHHHEIQL
ncbi:DNA polymerase III subunit chi [Candidatus Thiosymbion oneisti]|uniref:DNA polymerase III subunit chi n=1 Tax=Candidatus Thiosymbion oneisti TaxID=589554 RepID=UPI00105D6BAE|nr:DNA polymerase III subunit chi [Candidatus Thiosymbion oneisti]